MKLGTVKPIWLVILIAFITVVGLTLNGQAKDDDGDGLDDDWEGENGYNNKTKDKVYVGEFDFDNDGIVNWRDPDAYRKTTWSPDAPLWNVFVVNLIAMFGLIALLAGIFTAYFGAGKSRAIGAVLLIIGLLVLLGLSYLLFIRGGTFLMIAWNDIKVLEAFLTILGAIVGGLIAIGLFLVAIMKA
jgi:hypothetical protein